MRDIKFRLWENWNNVMRPWEDVKGFQVAILNRPESVVKDEFAIMEYTGVKDKNGIEIYEGDILKGEFESENFVVIWNPDGFNYQIKAINENNSPIMSLVNAKSGYEVIGNIYENGELLNGIIE